MELFNQLLNVFLSSVIVSALLMTMVFLISNMLRVLLEGVKRGVDDTAR